MQVNSDQTIFDIMLMGTGSVNNIASFIDINQINDINSLPTEVSFENLSVDQNVISYFKINNIKIASEIIEDENTVIPQAIGSASIGSTFIIN